jgi:ABC-type transport system substrate-binding protein
MLTEYTTRQRIVLEANPNRMKEYYPSDGDPGDREKGFLDDAGKELPLARKVVFSTVREGTTGWNMFLQGYLDNYGVTQDNFQQAMGRTGDVSPEMKAKGVKMTLGSDPNVRYFAFNMSDPVWGGLTDRGRKLRQAVSLSLNAQEFIDLSNFGYGEAAQFIIPPGIYGYDKSYRNPYRETNVAKAKQLLADAGYPGGIDPSTGKRLVLTYDHAYITPAGRQLVGLTKRLIEKTGITLDAQAWRPNVWQDRLDDGKFQLMDYGWLADYPDPENFVFLLYGPNKRPGPNASAYHNPEYDKLFEQMRSMDDTPARLAIIKRMREIAVEDSPWIYLTHDQDLYLTQPWVHNFKPHPVANDGVKYWGVDGPQRAQLQAEWNRPIWWPAVAVALFLMIGSLPAIAVVRNRTRRRIRVSGGSEATD